MKNTTALLTLTTVLGACAGCSHTDDGTKIDTLSQKIEVMSRAQMIMWSNQLSIWTELETVRSTVTNLPNIKTIDSMSYYYHTNAIDCIDDDLEKTVRFYGTNIEMAQSQQWMLYWQSKQDELTNSPLTPSSPQIDQNMLRTEMTVGDIDDDIQQIKADVKQIKLRLGLLY